jgi:hypothetical protein
MGGRVQVPALERARHGIHTLATADENNLVFKNLKFGLAGDDMKQKTSGINRKKLANESRTMALEEYFSSENGVVPL